MRNRADTQAFEPADIDLLQACYDTVVARRTPAPDTVTAEEIALALIIAHQRGVRDSAELIRLADIPSVI